ncbi:hypothetical protein FJT64_027332 [Amphibalanus amphitrite]|uniref:Uncharacterized protein n=1 Tax=Amphibalanus amphitrite TaxID=1232801 RepID=A0A6A4WAV9_AMPAM|nr:hypothetical protein FJT64_027332 [Amphibalanus amphitrite]
MPVGLVGVSVTVQVLVWRSNSRLLGMVQKSRLLDLLVDLWRIHLSILWQWSVLLPLVILRQGARELRQVTRWVVTELRKPVTDSQLGRLVGVYNECCYLSESLCSSLSPSIFMSLLLLNNTLVIMSYQSLVYYLPRCISDPRQDTIICAVCAVITVSITSYLMWNTFSECHFASEAAEDARQQLKHSAAAPQRETLSRPVLEKFQLTASAALENRKGCGRKTALSRVAKIVVAKAVLKRSQSTRKLAKKLTEKGHPVSKTPVHH